MNRLTVYTNYLTDSEPTLLWAFLYSIYIKYFTPTYNNLRNIEIHWLRNSAIKPEYLPTGATTYHFDYIPIFRKLHLSTKNKYFKHFFFQYRKVILKGK